MVDNVYTIKEVSKLLQCSPQNIYQQKNKLIQDGLMEQSETGTYYINEKGLNFLREKRIETIKSNTKDFNQLESNDFKEPVNPIITTDNNILIEMLKEQIQDLKNEKEYWKKQTEMKDQELKNKNDYIQELNTKAFTLLGTTEQNQKQSNEVVKKSFWKRIFD